MTMISEGHHPEPEALALFAEGGLEGEALRLVAGHLTGCEECREFVGETAAWIRENEGPSRNKSPRTPSVWLAVAAAVSVAIVAGILFIGRRPDPTRRLVAAIPSASRGIEPRLSGGFTWAPLRTMRGSDDMTDLSRVRLETVAKAVTAETRGDSPEKHHIRGVASLLLNDTAGAVQEIRIAAQKSDQSSAWSDLSAALYANSSRSSAPQRDLDEALHAADTALAHHANLPEAAFNRALILERLGRTAEAQEAWKTYRRIDPDSPWSAEALTHIK